jgi:hypothetical protein
MKKYIFLDIAIDKKAYRWTEVIEENEKAARARLHHEERNYLPLISELETSKTKTSGKFKKRNGRKEVLIKERAELKKMLKDINMTAEEADEQIKHAIMGSMMKLHAAQVTPSIEIS